MKKTILCIAIGFYGITLYAQINYPSTPKIEVQDTLWGSVYKDNYRWLEDLNDPKVVSWFKQQADFTNIILDSISGQDAIATELTEQSKSNFGAYRNITKSKNQYFYFKRNSDTPDSKLYIKNTKTGKETLLFDPQLYKDGTPISLNYKCSADGKRLLLGISEGGTEVKDFRILDVNTATMLPTVLPHSMFADFVSGSSDTIQYFQLKGYDIHDPLNSLNPKTLLHIVGTSVETDKIILSDNKYPDILDGVGWIVIKSYKNCPYMFAEKSTASNYKELYFADRSELDATKINWKLLCAIEDEIWDFWMNGEQMYYLTSKNNPYYDIKKIELTEPDLKYAIDIYKGTKDWKISFYGDIAEIYKAQDFLVINLSKNDIFSKNVLYDFKTGIIKELSFPLEGNSTVIPFSEFDNECRVTNYGWTMPNTYYNYDLKKDVFSKELFYRTPSYPGLDKLVVEEVEVASHDGIMVPMSIIYDKTKLKKDGTNIALLSGYGSYGTSLSPSFDSSKLPLLSRGVVIAIAHVRGGGEKGNEWHEAGKKANKPNTWKDFNACAEYLIDQNFASKATLACTGGSAGGILIGRAITERPDLFKVAIPKVGMLNPIRYIVQPNSEGNFPEFGTVTDSLEFKSLLEMDALQHVKKGVSYPAMLITTGYNDPRVPSSGPGKFAAAVQADNASKNPILLSVDFNSGHFGNAGFENYIKQTSKEYAFLLWQCGHPDFQPKEKIRIKKLD